MRKLLVGNNLIYTAVDGLTGVLSLSTILNKAFSIKMKLPV
jgi:hypothetical protein